MPNMILRGHKECPKSEKVSQKVSHAVRFSHCNAILCYHSHLRLFFKFCIPQFCHDDEDDEDDEDDGDDEDYEDDEGDEDEEDKEDEKI